MKRLTLLTLILVLTALVQLTAPPVQAEVSIPDAELAAVIRETLGLPAGEAITVDAMRNLPVELYAAGRGIADLTGLEHAVNLRGLNLGVSYPDGKWRNNPISNVLPLASLTNLRMLSLDNTAVSDISPLASLTNLTRLYLGGTAVSDISPLASLTNLWKLYLSGTAVSDISPLASLTNLEWLGLSGTAVDVSSLASLTNLTRLYLGGTAVSDISPLANLANLTGLSLWGTAVDVSSLASLTNLEWLDLNGTYVSDISLLASLTNLEWLNLKGTAVSDISLLASLTNLEWLNLWGTAVSDISPLASLTNLEGLWLSRTAVSDISPLASLTNLEGLGLSRTAVSDISPLASLTNLEWLSLEYTAVSDVSPLANLTNLEWLDLKGCPLNAAAHQTHIPAIQANGTSVEFDPFKPIQLPRIPSLVYLFYFRPSDRPVRPDVDAEIDALIKEAQRFFADEMERHGFGRKTFQFETDAHGNAVVHHVNGKFSEAYYRQNRGWVTETRGQIHIPRQSITVYMLDGNLYHAGGYGSGGPYDGGTAYIDSWSWGIIAHELGHAFGMVYHDFRDNRYIMSYGSDEELSPCFAAWLDVHPAFNPTVVRIGTGATIQMLPATLAAPPNAIRLRFTVTAPAGSLYQARLLTPQKSSDGFRSGGLIGCKRIDGNPTSSTVEFVTALTPDTEQVSLHIIGIGGEEVHYEDFPIDVASLLATAEVPPLVADVNGDGVVNIQDLVLIAGQFGKTGEHVADVNGDGVVNIQDLVLVAGAFGEGAAAPSVRAVSRARLTVSDVEEWLIEASRPGGLSYGEEASRPGGLSYGRGIAVLERLLASLMPKETVLLANYPNPFNPETWIPYQLSEPAEVTVTIYAANGAVVRRLDLGPRRAGNYDSQGRAAYWDGRNAAGESVASGVYFYTLSAGDFSATRKMVIRK